MKLTFSVNNQILTRTDSGRVIANSSDYLEVEVTFSSDWDYADKTIQFKNGDTVYTYVLVNNKITQDKHLILSVGTWKVSIFGVYGNQKITTNTANVVVNASGYIGVTGPNPDVYEELVTIMNSLHTEAASEAVVRSAVEAFITDNFINLVLGYVYENVYTKAQVDDLVPTHTSDLWNDSGFVDKTVDDLYYYYTKSETYDKDEVDGLISSAISGRFEPVEELPEEGEYYVIYLVPVENPGADDYYDEYIWTPEGWDKIGNTQIDLSNYYTKTETDSLLGNKVDKVNGKALSTNDFTDSYKTKLDGVAAGAEVNVQSDWNQADNTKDDFVKNKPNLDVYAEKDTLWDDATLTGNPVTFKTQSAQTAQSTILAMTPIQDLHGYGKPWAAGQGKNLCQPFTSGTNNNVTLTQNADGSITLSGTASAQAAMFTVPVSIPNNTYVTISLNNDAVNAEVGARLTDIPNGRYGTMVAADTLNKSQTVQTTFAATSINVFVKTNHGAVSTINLKVQVELGQTATAWTPWENICPISGRTGAEIVRCGKNLLEIADGVDYTTTHGVTVKTANNGEITLDGTEDSSASVAIWNLAVLGSTSTPQSDNKKHLPNGTYKATGLVPGMRIQIMGSNDLDAGVPQTTAINSFYVGHEEVVLNTDFKYTWLRLYINPNASFSNVTFKPMIYSTKYDDTTYEQFTKQTVTISLGQTVYGGTLNVETGELTIDTQRVELDTLNWSASTAPIVFFADDDLGEYIGNGRTIVACDSYASADNVSGLGGARSNPNGSICGFSGSGSHRIYLRDDSYSDAATLISALDGVYACYKLATPTTATLTAAQVNLIKGINNISTDADSLTITYFNDASKIPSVLSNLANVEGQTASQNYSQGDYLIFEDKFCKASTSITSGASLAIGTNLTQTTVAAELLTIIAQL